MGRFIILEDGDEIKILPFPKEKFSIYKEVDCIFNRLNNRVIYTKVGLIDKSLLNDEISVTRRCIFNSFKDGEFKLLTVSKRSSDIISSIVDISDVYSNDHIKIKKNRVPTGYLFTNFTKSLVISKEYRPVESEEWVEFITKNEPNTEFIIDNLKDSLLIDFFGNDFMSVLIKKDRDEKIGKILKSV